jgi:hypothetical protein
MVKEEAEGESEGAADADAHADADGTRRVSARMEAPLTRHLWS